MLFRQLDGTQVEVNRMDFLNDRVYYETIMKMHTHYEKMSIFHQKPPKRVETLVKISKVVPVDWGI
jgi:hypothetical protein